MATWPPDCFFRNFPLYAAQGIMVYFAMMKTFVYHGSDVEVRQPEIRRANRALDFGMGFYTTLNPVQATSFARKVRERNGSSTAIVNVYSTDLDALRTTFEMLTFERPDESWLDFVSDNRAGNFTRARYDAILGPVANDTIFKTFIAYQNGTLTKPETIERLKVRPLYNQLVFATERALALLSFERSFIVEEG